MKTVREVTSEIDARLGRTWPEVLAGDPTRWSARFSVGKPTAAQLVDDFPAVNRWATEWFGWAQRHAVVIESATRMVSGTRQELPTHVLVPDVETAATLAGADREDLLSRSRRRWALLADRFPGTATASSLRAVAPFGEVDFDLVLRAADWFAVHDATGLTPRQVPLEGFHSKWLEKHRSIVTPLSGRSDLGLVSRPTHVHYTYLDRDHLSAGARQHDCHTIGDNSAPAYDPRVAIVCENKDTAVFFPEQVGGISVQGGGYAAAGLLPLVPWLSKVPELLYWGDMDVDGFAILDGLRARGLPVRSILMDLDAYRRYERFGTSSDPAGRPIATTRVPELTHLDDDEAAVYRLVADPAWPGPRRIEQERIPLDAAGTAVEAALRRG